MTLQELQAAIVDYCATATEDQLQALGEMLIEEAKFVDEWLEDVKCQRECEQVAEERRREAEEEAVLPDAERLAERRHHRTSSAVVTVNAYHDGHCEVFVVTKPNHPADPQLSAVADECTHMIFDDTDWYTWTAQGQIDSVFKEAVQLLNAQFNASR